jgi:hypothetical protein
MIVLDAACAALSLAVAAVRNTNAILITMVPLVYVAGMSGAIHLSNYYLESLQRVGPDAAIGDAVRMLLPSDWPPRRPWGCCPFGTAT